MKRPNCSPLTADIFKLICAIPYIDWCEPLVEVLVERITFLCSTHFEETEKKYTLAKNDEKAKCEAQLDRAYDNVEATQKLVKFLRKNYLSPTAINGYLNWGYVNGEMDPTNNCAEVANHLLSCHVRKNITRYVTAVGVLYDYMAKWIEVPPEEVSFIILEHKFHFLIANV